MSWSGFKKNVGRATTQVMMKTGHVEKTSDREYEVEERRYRTLEAASLRLQKEAKGYLDSLRAMTASQMRIAETIDAFYGDSGARDGVSRSYKQAVEDLDAETVKALDGPYRCVPDSLLMFAPVDEETSSVDEEVVREIEKEMNFCGSRRRNYTRAFVSGGSFDGALELMDFVYRTTVLEPINRFCAYFPDINECIKKRNHKMLDYDAMRSKVKKLTEKPDKDPAKLPRAEKETEMVSRPDFLDENPLFPPLSQLWKAPSTPTSSKTTKALSRHSGEDDFVDELTEMPSPPKVLQRPEIAALKRKEREMADGEKRLGRSPSLLGRVSSLKAPRLGTAPWQAMLQRSVSTMSSVDARGIPDFAFRSSFDDVFDDIGKGKGRSSIDGQFQHAARCSVSLSSSVSHPSIILTPRKHRRSDESSSRTSIYGHRARASISHKPLPTPFFQPSELEDLMAPLRQEFLQTQADLLVQAKAAYEQLNEQLTTELPQLIDLRVPYLDPSFEALVKIQLRFCAEAYSRMAQVQQYLDASTRDQYASGDLDARVEDVLGQIRELSIAGTV